MSEKNALCYIFSYNSSASGALILEIVVIVDNKLMRYICYKRYFYHIFPNSFNTKI